LTTTPKAPPSEFTVRTDAGVVWVELHGKTSDIPPPQILGSIENELRQTGFGRVVFDMRGAVLNFNEIQLFERVREVEATTLMRQSAIAMLVPAISPRYQFLENSAKLAGHTMRLFTDGETALRWLARQPAPAQPEPSAKIA
jgi:hypothetical protein